MSRGDKVYVQSTGEQYVLNKLIDLALRCGVSPTVAEIDLSYHSPEQGGCYYNLCAYEPGDVNEEKVERMWKLLGLSEDRFRRFDSLEAVDKAVDEALSQLPRPRIR